MKSKETNETSRTDRQPAVAGSFYPANPEKLKDALNDAFAHAVPKETQNPVVAIISPHAGYVYSAKVAASAFNQIDTTKEYEHIFVIGSSHRVHFEGAAVYTAGNFITPLGKIKTDPLGEELVKHPDFSNNIAPHQAEHSIEVQLPFLQYLLQRKFSIIPIILGTQSVEMCEKIATRLMPYFNEKNLFIISTDFSHYPDYNTAIKTDASMAEAVISNSPEILRTALNNIEDRHTPNLLTGMCGWTSVLTLMNMSSAMQGITIKKVDYQNSGDTPFGDKSRVVGYVALAVELQPKDTAQETKFSLTEEEKHTLLSIARKSIEEFVRNKHIPCIDPELLIPALKNSCGVFVGLHLHDDLRGCIGTFRSDKPLYQNVQNMAIAAAVNDCRFNPVKPEELNDLEIEISVLTPMHKISSIDEIIPGKHGIYIKKNGKAGTLLPQVAQDKGWSREKFLGYCSRNKAGLGWEGWREADIYIYEAIVFSEQN